MSALSDKLAEHLDHQAEGYDVDGLVYVPKEMFDSIISSITTDEQGRLCGYFGIEPGYVEQHNSEFMAAYERGAEQAGRRIR